MVIYALKRINPKFESWKRRSWWSQLSTLLSIIVLSSRCWSVGTRNQHKILLDPIQTHFITLGFGQWIPFLLWCEFPDFIVPFSPLVCFVVLHDNEMLLYILQVMQFQKWQKNMMIHDIFSRKTTMSKIVNKY